MSTFSVTSLMTLSLNHFLTVGLLGSWFGHHSHLSLTHGGLQLLLSLDAGKSGNLHKDNSGKQRRNWPWTNPGLCGLKLTFDLT